MRKNIFYQHANGERGVLGTFFLLSRTTSEIALCIFSRHGVEASTRVKRIEASFPERSRLTI